jgi:hypothetical protein
MPKRLEIHPLGARWEDADEVLAAVATLRQASGDGLGTQGSKRIGVWGGRARESIRSFSQKWFSGRDRVVERRGTDGESDAHGPRDSDDMPFQAVNRPPITKETVRESQKKDADRPGMGGWLRQDDQVWSMLETWRAEIRCLPLCSDRTHFSGMLLSTVH